MTKEGKFKQTLSKYAFVGAMLIVPILNFLVFYLYVNFDSILLAFQRPIASGGEEWTLENFLSLWRDLQKTDSIFWESLRNTLTFFFVNMCVVLPISLLLCYFLYKKVSGYRFFRFVFYLPSIISATVYVMLFKYIIQKIGPYGLVCEWLGIEPVSLIGNSNYAMKTIVFYTIWSGLGGNIILLSGAMSHIDESIVEAAKIDGCGIWREIVNIVIPLIWPTLSTMITLAFVGIFGSSGPILLFTEEPKGTYTIAYWIYKQVRNDQSYYYPAAIGLIFTVIGLPIALGMRALLNKFSDGGES